MNFEETLQKKQEEEDQGSLNNFKSIDDFRIFLSKTEDKLEETEGVI